MATIKFHLRTKIDKLAPVYIRLTDTGGVNLIVRTPFKMVPSYWNAKKQVCKTVMLESQEFTAQDAADVVSSFDKLRDHILKAYFNLRSPVNAEWLSATIDSYFYKDAPKNETLHQYFNRFYKEAKAGTRLAAVGDTRRPYAYETLRSIKGTKLSFEMFEKETKRKSNFNDVTIDWYNDFLQFFYKRGCSANYIGRHIKTIKTIMRAAVKSIPTLRRRAPCPGSLREEQ